MSEQRLENLSQAASLFGTLATAPVEMLGCAYLAADGNILAIEMRESASVSSIAVPIREIVVRAIALDADVLIIAHNHPSGVAEASDTDISMTRRLALALDLLDFTLAEHLIFAGDDIVSFRDLGLL